MNVLIVHGPNLNLLGELKSDSTTYAALNSRLEAFAMQLGLEVKIFQSNHEGAIVDTIQAERDWADAILINPMGLTHTSYSLREAIRIAGKPTIEVHLEDIRRRETWRRRSVIKDVCEAQVMGRGVDSYLDGLERIATGKYRGSRRPSVLPEEHAVTKTVGRISLHEAVSDSSPVSSTSVIKTLGRRDDKADAQAGSQSPLDGHAGAPSDAAGTVGAEKWISRARVRQQIAAMLGNSMTPAALASWAREQWLNIQGGAAVENGQKELLEDVLQTLAARAAAKNKISDQDLIELMTRLE